MPGPKTPAEARKWVRQALQDGHFTPSVHFWDRVKDRSIDFLDVRSAIQRSRAPEPYSEPPRHGGTCWQMIGRDVDGERTIVVGVEAFWDEGRGPKPVAWVKLCTTYERKDGKR